MSLLLLFAPPATGGDVRDLSVRTPDAWTTNVAVTVRKPDAWAAPEGVYARLNGAWKKVWGSA
jgi:hypothetical protein